MMRFSAKQRRVLTWWRPDSPDAAFEAIICDGAVRSGKTLCMGLSFFLWASACFSGARFGLCGKTIASLRRNVVTELLPKLQAIGFSVRERRTENLLQVSYRGHTNEFYLFGGRDEGSAALIQGITFAGVLQPRGAVPLVLHGVDRPRGGAELPVPPLYDGGQPRAVARYPQPLCAAVLRRVLPPLRAGPVGGG